jgi:hypothetical protein
LSVGLAFLHLQESMCNNKPSFLYPEILLHSLLPATLSTSDQLGQYILNLPTSRAVHCSFQPYWPLLEAMKERSLGLQSIKISKLRRGGMNPCMHQENAFVASLGTRLQFWSMHCHATYPIGLLNTLIIWDKSTLCKNSFDTESHHTISLLIDEFFDMLLGALFSSVARVAKFEKTW